MSAHIIGGHTLVQALVHLAGAPDHDPLLHEVPVGHDGVHQVGAQHGPLPDQPLQAGQRATSGAAVKL